MAKVFRPTRKASDEDIVRLNSVGLSLSTIGQMLGIHWSCVSDRLRNLGIARTDTRRAFMEDILHNLTDDQRMWLVEEVEKGVTIKQFVENLIVEKFNTSKGNTNVAS